MYGGPEQAIRAINQNFGLDIQDYVTVNFASMAKIVDAFGGVNIDLTEDEISEINKNMYALAAESPESMAGDVSTYAPLSAGEGVLLTATKLWLTGVFVPSTTITAVWNASRRCFLRF